MANKDNWCYSYNAENFEGNFETKEDAIEEATIYYNDYHDDEEENEHKKIIYIGKPKPVTISFNVDSILEDIAENAFEQCGEYSEGYLDNVKIEDGNILEERLHKEILKWMDEFNYKPHFWRVKDVEEVEI